MKYTIKIHECWNQPYNYDDLSQMCQYESTESYVVNTAEICKKAVKDMLDTPNAPLTVEQVKADFESHDYSLTDQQVNSIQEYYNGRFALQERIYADIDANSVGEFHYPIFERYNRFSRYDDEYDKQTKQLDAYIELKIENS